MAIYETKWWKKIFKEERNPKVDTVKDINAVKEHLQEIHDEVQPLLSSLNELEELEKEREVGKSGIIKINLETQAKIFDNILERYEFFQNDIDINGLRLKRISKEFLKHAHKAGLKDLVNEKKNDMKWTFDW